MSVSVCLSVRLHNHTAELRQIFVHVAWRRFDMLCTSGFVDDVMFLLNGPMARLVYS